MTLQFPRAPETFWRRKQLLRPSGGLLVYFALFCQPLGTLAQTAPDGTGRRATITVLVRPGHPANRFIPAHALRAGVDGHEKGEADRQLKPENIKEMLSAGLRSLTYRLRTELANDAWHWNPQGTWSDTNGKRGYWISDSS